MTPDQVSTHTPGPWTAEWFTDSMGESWWWVNFNPDGPAEDRSRVSDDHILVDEANARLIAAAPDLYEALRDLLKHAETADRYGQLDVHLRARDALLKVEP